MHRNGQRNGTSDLWVGLVAGLIGGAVGSWTMEQFQAAWNSVSARLSKKQDEESEEGAEGGNGEAPEPATVRVASVFSQRLFHHELSEKGKQVAGPAVHYGFGSTMGAVYGTLAAVAPKATVGVGMPFGAALWFGADEATLPVLGLAEAPTKYPVSMHAYALASHLVYGLTTEMVRRTVLSAWRRVSR